jgi:hypothetical protein
MFTMESMESMESMEEGGGTGLDALLISMLLLFVVKNPYC